MMTYKDIKKLVNASYRNGVLHEDTVMKIADMLDTRDGKAYLRGIKLEEQKKRVIVAVPTARIYNDVEKWYIEVFPDKTVEVREDAFLMLGPKITAGDMVYDASLKHRLDEFIEQIEQQYE